MGPILVKMRRRVRRVQRRPGALARHPGATHDPLAVALLLGVVGLSLITRAQPTIPALA